MIFMGALGGFSMEFPMYFKEIQRIQECFKDISSNLQHSLRLFPENFKGVSRNIEQFQRSFMGVSLISQRSSKGVSRKFQRCFKKVYSVF